MRALGGKGHLYSFEYNKERAEAAQKEFKELLADNVSIFNRDAYKDGFIVEGCCEAGQADCVFLDLPSPWLAVDHAKQVMRKGGR